MHMFLENYKASLDSLEKITENQEVITKITDFIIEHNPIVFIIGIGKSGYIAHKAAASMSSTGTRAVYIHPSEAMHGDIGLITDQDICIFVSYSGESMELIPVAQKLKNDGVKIVSVVANENSSLGKLSNFILRIPKVNEPTDLPAPFISTCISLVMLDMLCISLINKKNFTIDLYKQNHPAGKIGSVLKSTGEIMRKNNDLPLVLKGTKMSDALVIMNEKRLGSLIVVNQENLLLGFISEGDLRRHMHDHLLTDFVENIMTTSPKTISSNTLCIDALDEMRQYKITSLIVVSHGNIVEGMVHIHQLLELFGDE